MRTIPLAAAIMVLPPLAAAQAAGPPLRVPCFRQAEVARQLERAYAEVPVSLGLEANGNLLQLYKSADSATWTIVSTSPDGVACVLAAGRNWETLTPKRVDPAA